MEVGNFISIISIITGAVTIFFALKAQVDKLSILVENTTEELRNFRKTIESVSKNLDSEIIIIKTRFEDFSRKIKSLNNRVSEIEENGCKRKK
ncbi:MAG: hypothetical protein L6Q54_10995 [Leptospiraceae bacterium]|nr:hypothetical protein [Leptospiraceae bacterium]MCK6381754.1 hypothetical protein [Leptospiraceae bacterium]